eukprot:scaffold1581_cov169-Amphora_coffeaeformis.AAC.28
MPGHFLNILGLLFLWVGADVTAFFPSSSSSRQHRSACSDWREDSFHQRRNEEIRLCQASIAEDTHQGLSADSQEPDDKEANNQIKITDLSQIVKPSMSLQQHSQRNGKSHNRKNAAMADASFLRKRTANLIKVTAADHENKEILVLGGSMKIDKKTFHFLLDAWAFSGEPDAVPQATRLVERMEDLRSRHNKISPDVRSYTKLINAISRSGELDAGEKAEQILHKMDMLYQTGSNPDVKPNTYTYTAVIEAHANSGAPGSTERAGQLCELMVQKYENGDEDVTPIARAFQAALVAHAKSGDVGSAERAEQILDRMEELYDSGIEEMKPTAVNLNTLINAWANCGEEGSAQRAEEVLRRMEYLYKAGDEDLKPTTVSFNAVIDAYAKSGEEEAAEKAEHVLKFMEFLFESGENKDAKPNVRSFNSVINAWAKSRDYNNAERAQEILDHMEQLYEEGTTALRPDVHSFSSVINAWARSSVHGKAERALNLFRKMESLYKAGNKHLRPTVVSYNAVMNACAYTSNSDLHEQNRAIEIAHRMLRDLEISPYGEPDQITYGTFLKVCANQMPDCSNREQIVESIFKKCCNDGQVGNLVLQQLRAIAHEGQYQKLVGRSIFDDVRMEDLPSEWWCNVVEGRWRRRKNQAQN